MKCLFVIILFAIQFQVVSQVFMPVSVKHNLRNNAGEVAREGCMFSYTEIENYDYLFFGFKGNNKALACVNGKSIPPFECQDFFIDDYSIVDDVLYLYSSTIINCKKEGDFEDIKMAIRLKLVLKDDFGDKLSFKKKEDLFVASIKGNFSLFVKMEMAEYNNQNIETLNWKSVLDLFDELNTNPKILIFTSFEESEMEFLRYKTQ